MEINLAPVIGAAVEAGKAILSIYNGDFEVYEKEDKSSLTEADLASHRIITRFLSEYTPKIPLLSEESAAAPYDERRKWEKYWLIDPLDGTREFVNRNGEFTVNIALIENGVPVLGVVHVPVSGITYCGSSGTGSFMIREGNSRPINVARPAAVPPRVVGSRSHAGESLKRFLENVGEHQLVSMGSSLKLCLVAEGAADIYPRLGPTSEWDTAAAQAVVETAGGVVVDCEGVPLRYNTKESLLNPEFLVIGDDTIDWLKFL